MNDPLFDAVALVEVMKLADAFCLKKCIEPCANLFEFRMKNNFEFRVDLSKSGDRRIERNPFGAKRIDCVDLH